MLPVIRVRGVVFGLFVLLTWRPFLVTPPYPDYPYALPTASGASTAVLRRFFGTDDIAFVRTNNAAAVPLPPPLAALPPKTITRHFEAAEVTAGDIRSAAPGEPRKRGCCQRRHRAK